MDKIVKKLNMLKKISVNIVDVLVVLIFISLILSFISFLVYEKKLTGENIYITVRMENDFEICYSENIDDNVFGKVFLNSADREVEITGVRNIDKGDSHWVEVTIGGIGQIDNDRIIFNGTRISIGQKAEIHSKYNIKGIVTEAKYVVD